MKKKRKTEIYKGWAVLHPKGYLRMFEDTGRYMVYVDIFSATKQQSRRPDCYVVPCKIIIPLDTLPIKKLLKRSKNKK